MDKTAETLELRDIHLPADPSYWPLAPGWWMVIIIAVIIAYIVVKKIAKIRLQNHKNQRMQSELMSIRNAFNKHNSKHQFAVDISELLNRFIKHVLNDSNATALSGQAWIDYLNSRIKNPVFDEFKRELTLAQYQPDVDFDMPRLFATVKNYFPVAIKSVDQFNKKSGSVSDA